MGFKGRQAAVAVYDFDWPDDAAEKLRRLAFNDIAQVAAEKFCAGWTEFGETAPLSSLLTFGDFSAWSMRYDTRKPNAARVKMLVEKKLAEMRKDGLIPNRKLVKAGIAQDELYNAPWIPHTVDVIYDHEKGRLYVSTLSDSILDAFDALMTQTFGDAATLIPSPSFDPFVLTDALTSSLKGDDTALAKLTGLPLKAMWGAGTKMANISDGSKLNLDGAVEPGMTAIQCGYEFSRCTVEMTVAEEDDTDVTAIITAYGRLACVKFPPIKIDKGDEDAEVSKLWIHARLISVLSNINYNTPWKGDQ